MISWRRVDELKREIGAADFEEVVQLFLVEVEEVVERLRADPDPARFEADLHFLKGSALNLGFEGFGTRCGDGEKAAAAGAAEVDIGAILAAYEASKLEFLRGAPAA